MTLEVVREQSLGTAPTFNQIPLISVKFLCCSPLERTFFKKAREVYQFQRSSKFGEKILNHLMSQRNTKSYQVL